MVLLGGPDEVAFARTVGQAGGPGVTDLSGQTSLRDLIGIFTRCRLAFGPDSGPMHIAAASGAPVVSLWGATSPVRSAPLGLEAVGHRRAGGVQPVLCATVPHRSPLHAAHPAGPGP